MVARNLTRLCENLNNTLPDLPFFEENWIIRYKCYFSTKIRKQRKLECIVFKTHNLLAALTHAFPVFGCGNIMKVYAVFQISQWIKF